MKNRTKNVALIAIMAAVIVVATFIDKAYSFGLVAVGGASLAVCSLVAVVTCALLFNKFWHAAVAGALFGIVSFVLAYIFPSPIFQNPLASIVPRLFIGIIGFGAYRLAQIVAKAVLKFVSALDMGITVPVILLAADVSGMIAFIALGGGKGWVFFLVLVALVFGLLLSAGLLLAVETARSRGDNGRKLEHFSLCLGALFTVVANTVLVLPMMMLLSDAYSTLADIYAVLTVLNFLPELVITVALAPVVLLGVRRGLRLGVDGRPRIKTSGAEKNDNDHNAAESTKDGNA